MYNEDLKKVIGQRLQLMRLEKHLTQEYMGEQLNISTSAYCKIEYGETNLTLTRLNQIARIFEVTGTQLLGMLEGGPFINTTAIALLDRYRTEWTL